MRRRGLAVGALGSFPSSSSQHQDQHRLCGHLRPLFGYVSDTAFRPVGGVSVEMHERTSRPVW